MENSGGSLAHTEILDKKLIINVSTGKSKRSRKKNSDKALTSSTISTVELKQIIQRLELSRFRNTTRQNYLKIWRLFNQFIIRLDAKPDNWADRLTLFVGNLVNQNKQSKTIKSYISAVKAILKENRIKVKEDSFALSSMTRACRIRNDKAKVRLPINKEILLKILHRISIKFGSQPYLKHLYRAVICTAYFGMFRVGELSNSNHNIQARNVQIGENKDKLRFTLYSSKTHCEGDKPQMVMINAIKGKAKNNHYKSKQKTCPFAILQRYLEIRAKGFATAREPFFIYRDRTTLSAGYLRTLLKQLLEEVGQDPKNFSFHSLRIGRSHDLWKLGVAVNTIRKLGRWSAKSNVVYNYLK